MTQQHWLMLLEEIEDDPDAIASWLYRYPRLPESVRAEYERAHEQATKKRDDLLH